MERDAAQKVPMELYHLFLGKPQCGIVSDVYVSDKHLHKEVEIVYVLRGQLDVCVEQRVFSVNAGEALCIAGSVLHQYRSKPPDTDLAKIKFIKDWLMPAFFDAGEREVYRQLYGQVFQTRADPRIEGILHDMLHCGQSRFNEYYHFAKLAEWTAYLLCHPSIIRERMPIERENARYMESALKYMQDNCFDKLTLKMLADHLGLTQSYCSKYMKRNTGMTFVEYLNAMRVNNAQRLLIYTGRNITEIAEQAGFLSVQTFNRVFKAQTGLSPSAYRKRKRQPQSK